MKWISFFILVSNDVMRLGLLENICSCDAWGTCGVWMHDHKCCTCKVVPLYVSVGAAWESHGEWRCGHSVGKWGPAGPQAPPQDTPVQPTTTPVTQTPRQLQQLHLHILHTAHQKIGKYTQYFYHLLSLAMTYEFILSLPKLLVQFCQVFLNTVRAQSVTGES